MENIWQALKLKGEHWAEVLSLFCIHCKVKARMDVAQTAASEKAEGLKKHSWDEPFKIMEMIGSYLMEHGVQWMDGKGRYGVQFVQEEGEKMLLEHGVGAGQGMLGMPWLEEGLCHRWGGVVWGGGQSIKEKESGGQVKGKGEGEGQDSSFQCIGACWGGCPLGHPAGVKGVVNRG